jgi:CRISPR/Cas system endoribonuclease Cas6 (RAMP superfamily)
MRISNWYVENVKIERERRKKREVAYSATSPVSVSTVSCEDPSRSSLFSS